MHPTKRGIGINEVGTNLQPRLQRGETHRKVLAHGIKIKATPKVHRKVKDLGARPYVVTGGGVTVLGMSHMMIGARTAARADSLLR